MNRASYEITADLLVERILKTVPRDKLLFMINVEDLLKIKGFKCDDLQPSYFQASWALKEAQRRCKKGKMK